MSIQVKADEISIKNALNVVTSYAKESTLITLTTFIMLAIIVYKLPKQFVSEAILAPNEQHSSPSSLGNIGGLASLAGISINESSSNTQFALEVMKSRSFLEAFIQENDLENKVCLKNKNSNSCPLPTGENSKENINWVRKTILQNLVVSQNRKTSIIKLQYTSNSKVLSQEILTKLISYLNTAIKKKEIEAAESSIRYLKKQISTTSIAEMHSIFYKLIEQQYKTIMLTSAKKDYAFKIIDPPFLPITASSPNKPALTLLSIFPGLILSLIYIFIMHTLKPKALPHSRDAKDNV